MFRYWHILRWNLAAVRGWHVLATLLLFLLVGWQSAGRIVAIAQTEPGPVNLVVWDGVLIGLGGPGLTDSSLQSLLRWFVPLLLFFYIIGDLIAGELGQRGQLIVPRIGSRLGWWLSKLQFLAVAVIGYVLLALVGTLAGASLRLPWAWAWPGGALALAGVAPPMTSSGAIVILGALWFFGGTCFALALWQTTAALLLQRAFYGLVLIIGVLLGSWLVGTGRPALVRWLPGSQSMVLRHTFVDPQVAGFSWQWSAIYNLLLAVCAIGIGGWYAARMDVFGDQATERH